MSQPISRIMLPTGNRTRILDTGGPGQPLILIHGLAASIEIWDRLVPLLQGRYRLIAFDLPGYGEADRPDGTYDAPFFVHQLKALMDVLGLRSAHLLGSSLGASLIVRFSAENRARIDKAVLAAPGGFGPEVHPFLQIPTLPFIGYTLGRPMRPTNTVAVKLAMADQKNATRSLIDIADRYSKMPGGHRAFVRTLKAVIGPLGVRDRESFEAQARGLDAPTLVVWGKQDRLFPCSQINRARELLPRATLQLLDRCGHYPQWERPEEFAAAIQSHLG